MQDGRDDRATSRTQRATAATRRARSVLIVGEHACAAEALAAALDDGCQLALAPDGIAALRAIDDAEHAFDYVVSDVKMPWMNGVDLHRALVARGDDLARRFTFMSASPLSIAHEAYVRQHQLVVLAKPFSRHALAAAIDGIAARGPRRTG